jgi:hypothetical protein
MRVESQPVTPPTSAVGPYETVRYWWNRFGPMFAAEIRRKRVDRTRG